MKRTVFSFLTLLLTAAMVFAGGQQGSTQPAGGTQSAPSGTKQINGGRPVTLRIEMHAMNPSENEVPTPESPTVRNSTRRIAEKFMKLHPNVTVEWELSKPKGNPQAAAEWFTTRIASGTCPAVAFTWDNAYLDRDWYYDLTSVFETPNEYIPGNTRWKDIYPEHIWTTPVVDSQGRIILAPIEIGTGAPTAFFINKDAFSKLNLKYPENFEDLRAAVKAFKAAGYMGMLPYPYNPHINTDVWAEWIVAPGYINALKDTIDYDKNGSFDTSDAIRAVKAGHFNPVTKDYVREVLGLYKEVYNDMYPAGWETMDVNTAWAEGKAGIKWDGVWTFSSEASNTKRTFDYQILHIPLVDHNTSKFVKDIEYTAAGPYRPAATGYNLMKPTVENDPAVLEAAVAWMKFLCVPENLNEFLLEDGTRVGAVKGTVVPPLLVDWMRQPAPITVPGVRWPFHFTSDANVSMSRELEQWVKGQTSDAVFFRNWNDLQQKSADDAVKSNNIDTTGW